MTRVTMLLAVGGLTVSSILHAATPSLVNYQGVLTDGSGTPQVGGPFTVTFSIYDDASATNPALWTESQSVTTDAQGRFNVLLGTVTPLTDPVFSSADRWLGTRVSPDVADLLPRTRIVTVAYAFRSATVDGASGGTITTKVSIGLGHTNTGDNAFVAGFVNTASGHNSAVGGGEYNTASGELSTIGGGSFNVAGDYEATVGGGDYNNAGGFKATIGGGGYNTAGGSESTVGGGSGNEASGQRAVIGGGSANTAGGPGATVGGGLFNRAWGQFSVISGGGGPTLADSNSAIGDYSTIGGGRVNVAGAYSAMVGGGEGNRASGFIGTVAGGASNTASNDMSTVGGGWFNQASGIRSTVGGGHHDTASGDWATVAGGLVNIASGSRAAVGGGEYNTASGSAATIPGGASNTASGSNSFAAGTQAKAIHAGAFVWADFDPGYDVTSTGENQFIIRASGGVGIGTNSPLDPLHVEGDIRVGDFSTGCVKDADGTVIAGTCSSDERLKTNIEPFPTTLGKLVQLQPVNFFWRTEEYPDRHFGKNQSFGLIAQQVEKVLPDLVTEDEEGYLAVRYNKLPLLLLQAVKDLKAENDELKSRVLKLEQSAARAQMKN